MCSSSKFQVTPYSPRRNSLGHTSKEKHSNFRLTQCSFGLKMSFHSKFIQSSFKVHSCHCLPSRFGLPCCHLQICQDSNLLSPGGWKSRETRDCCFPDEDMSTPAPSTPPYPGGSMAMLRGHVAGGRPGEEISALLHYDDLLCP